MNYHMNTCGDHSQMSQEQLQPPFEDRAQCRSNPLPALIPICQPSSPSLVQIAKKEEIITPSPMMNPLCNIPKHFYQQQQLKIKQQSETMHSMGTAAEQTIPEDSMPINHTDMVESTSISNSMYVQGTSKQRRKRKGQSDNRELIIMVKHQLDQLGQTLAALERQNSSADDEFEDQQTIYQPHQGKYLGQDNGMHNSRNLDETRLPHLRNNSILQPDHHCINQRGIMQNNFGKQPPPNHRLGFCRRAAINPTY